MPGAVVCRSPIGERRPSTTRTGAVRRFPGRPSTRRDAPAPGAGSCTPRPALNGRLTLPPRPRRLAGSERNTKSPPPPFRREKWYDRARRGLDATPPRSRHVGRGGCAPSPRLIALPLPTPRLRAPPSPVASRRAGPTPGAPPPLASGNRGGTPGRGSPFGCPSQVGPSPPSPDTVGRGADGRERPGPAASPGPLASSAPPGRPAVGRRPQAALRGVRSGRHQVGGNPPAKTIGATAGGSPAGLYFERQDRRNCWLHAFNMAVGRRVFTPESAAAYRRLLLTAMASSTTGSPPVPATGIITMA